MRRALVEVPWPCLVAICGLCARAVRAGELRVVFEEAANGIDGDDRCFGVHRTASMDGGLS